MMKVLSMFSPSVLWGRVSHLCCMRNSYSGKEKEAVAVSVFFRVTIPLVQNLQLTTRQKFRFGLACPGLARAKRNFCLEVN